MTSIRKAIFLMWVVLALCLVAPFLDYKYAEIIDEGTTTFVLLALAIMTDTIIAYLLLALAIGKLIDGIVSPDAYSLNELIWDILCFLGAIILHIYRRKNKPHESRNYK